MVAALALLRRLTWRWALGALAAALSLAALTVLGFEALRAVAGLPPFWTTYLSHQVLPSITQGRHHPDSNPLFFARPLVSWYLPGLLFLVAAAALALGRPRAWAQRFPREVALWGALLWAGVVVGFSVPAQKYDWYIHPGLLGAALVAGAVLASLPDAGHRWLGRWAVALAVLWPPSSFVPWEAHLSAHQRQLLAIQRLAAPAEPRVVADCSSLGPWASEHLMAFEWDARRVGCGESAPWRFDGERLERLAP